MSEEMIEVVARALYDEIQKEVARFGNPSPPLTYDADDEEVRCACRAFARTAIAAYNPNERLREALERYRTVYGALVIARTVVASDAAACKVFRHPDEDPSEPERVLGVIDSALSPLPQGED